MSTRRVVQRRVADQEDASMADEKQDDASSRGKAIEVLIEDASDDEDECCPSCEDLHWMRIVARYKSGVAYMIYCGACGKPLEENWNPNP
jgi:hypothetical protein